MQWEGYESVALIPLYLGKERLLGLVQMNDRRIGIYTPQLDRPMGTLGRISLRGPIQVHHR